MKLLSIIIVNYNARDLIRECLHSIYAGTHIPFEIIIVDNISSDGSVEMLGKEFPSIKLIKNTENVGFARANNQGIKASGGDLILLLNPDTKIIGSALDRLANFLDADIKAGAAGPLLVNADGNALYTSGRPSFGLCSQINYYWNAAKYIDSVLKNMDRSRPSRVGQLSGCCLMLKKEALDKTGMLDENYFMYYEDSDMCLRINKAGYELVLIPDVRIIHYGGKSTEDKAASLKYGVFSTKYYFRKNFGFMFSLYLHIALLSLFILRLPYVALLAGLHALLGNKEGLAYRKYMLFYTLSIISQFSKTLKSE